MFQRIESALIVLRNLGGFLLYFLAILFVFLGILRVLGVFLAGFFFACLG